MTVEILKVTSEHEIKTVSKLAKEIWTEHFIPIIGESQVNYMISKFQSYQAIKSQILNGYEYYLVKDRNDFLAYTGLVPDPENSRMMINKIYVKNEVRGTGFGKIILNFIEDQCKMRKMTTLWLTVNRYNDAPIAWYIHNAFKIVNEVKKDIGAGFYMDDFIMEKKI